MVGVEESQGQFPMSDGFGLFYRTWRSPGEVHRTVLGLHGIEAHSGALSAVGQALASDGTHVYAIDRRGFGNSTEAHLPRGDTSDYARHLKDIDESVDAVRRLHPGKKLFLFGHSIGCGYALRHVAHHPRTVDGIVLAAPPVETIKVPAADILGLLFRPRAMYDLLDKWPAAVKRGEEFRLLVQDPLCTRMFSGRYLIKTQRILFTKMLKYGSQVATPALILHGGSDPLAFPRGAQRLFESLRAADKSIRTFTDADHWFYQTTIPGRTTKFTDEQRSRVLQPVVDWIRAH